MKAVILAGGFGTRLRPLSCTRPKILFPIVNKPLLQWTFERLAQNNINNVVLAVFHQTEVHIKHHRVQRRGLHVTYSHDPFRKPLGTGGSVKKAERYLGHSAPFLVLNGDIFADVNYTEILKTHKEKNATATIALYDVKNPSRYGVAVLSKDERITRFIEKPRLEDAPSRLINAGVYVFDPEIFRYIPEGRAISIEREVFPKLAEEGGLYGHVFKGPWMDIGKPEDYLQINRQMLDLPSHSKEIRTRNNWEIRNPIAVDKKVIIGEKSTIGPYTVLGRNVIIGKHVRIENSVVFPETRISDFSLLNGAIIGEGVTIGRKVNIEEKCIVGDHATIRNNISLGKEVHVCPADEVSKSVLTSNNNC